MSTPSVKSNSYIPKHLRKAQELEPSDLTQEVSFPTLGNVTRKDWNTNKKTFKEKIDDLITLDKLTEEQRANIVTEEEFTILHLPLTADRITAFNEKIIQQKKYLNESKDVFSFN